MFPAAMQQNHLSVTFSWFWLFSWVLGFCFFFSVLLLFCLYVLIIIVTKAVMQVSPIPSSYKILSINYNFPWYAGDFRKRLPLDIRKHTEWVNPLFFITAFCIQRTPFSFLQLQLKQCKYYRKPDQSEIIYFIPCKTLYIREKYT